MGTSGPWRFARVMTRLVVEEVARRLRLLSKYPFRDRHGYEPRTSAPSHEGLRPGQLVQIRTRAEIRETLTPEGKNRGLWFDREMLPYCGKTARVKTKVERFIDEGSRALHRARVGLLHPRRRRLRQRSERRTVVLPRAIYPWWREAWLEPVDNATADTTDKRSEVAP